MYQNIPTKVLTGEVRLSYANLVNRHYISSYKTATSKVCKSGAAKVTAINATGTHPYHLVAVSGKGSTVYGWVDAADVAELAGTSYTPAVGDTVQYNGSIHYNNANAATGQACKGGKAKITQIYQLGKSKHPYHLIHNGSDGATVHGWVDAGSFTKVKEANTMALKPIPKDIEALARNNVLRDPDYLDSYFVYQSKFISPGEETLNSKVEKLRNFCELRNGSLEVSKGSKIVGELRVVSVTMICDSIGAFDAILDECLTKCARWGKKQCEKATLVHGY